MCLCAFGGAAVLQTYDPAKSQLKKFSFVPGQGLKVTYQGEAPSEARRPGNKFWPEGPGMGENCDAMPSSARAAARP